MKKILTILTLSFFIFANSFAGSDGELNLSKKQNQLKIVLSQLIDLLLL
jgi:hypothetical protein